MIINVINIEKPLNEELLVHLSDPEVLLNNKLWINLCTSLKNIKIFEDFLKSCLKLSKYPLFKSI